LIAHSTSHRGATPRVRPYIYLLALAGLCTNILLALWNTPSWSADFSQYYTAGRVAGTGRLYDWDLVRSLEREHHSSAVPFGRMPVFAAGFKPLSALPYGLARAAWLALGIAAAAGFVLLWPLQDRRWGWVVLCWSAPVAMCLAFGQDTVLFLCFAAAGLALLLRGRDFQAGLVLALCASKPHLAILVPVLLVARRRWECLLGGVAGGTVLLSLSFAVEGPQWVSRYLAISRLPIFDPAPNRMPNLRGLLSAAGAGWGIEIALALILLATFYFVARRLPLRAGAALALAGGLLAGHHGYVYDAPLLLPALLLPFEWPAPEFVRKWAVLLATPIPYLALLTDAAPAAQLVLAGYFAALMYALWPRPEGAWK
jgi:hypothetical protein